MKVLLEQIIKPCHQDISYNVVWRQGSLNPSDYLSCQATPLRHLPCEVHKETSEFKNTVWFLQYVPYTEVVSMSIQSVTD